MTQWKRARSKTRNDECFSPFDGGRGCDMGNFIKFPLFDYRKGELSAGLLLTEPARGSSLITWYAMSIIINLYHSNVFYTSLLG